MKRLLIALILIPTLCWGYTPPAGIPDPADYWTGFGEIDQTTPVRTTACPNWVAGTVNSIANGDAKDCYYVDNTFNGAASCVGAGDPVPCCTGAGAGATCVATTDSSNTYGYPNKPRKTIPMTNPFSEGAYIYVHAGTYSTLNVYLRGVGTAANPNWFTGNATTKPIIGTYAVYVGYNANASYWVIENFEKTGAYGVKIGPAGTGLTVDHILVRNMKMHGNALRTDGSAISFTDSHYDTSSCHNLVVYNNEIYNYGEWDPADNVENDKCGVIHGPGHVHDTWTLNNSIYHVGGDAVAGAHATTVAAGTQPYNVFIGSNNMYELGENCVDLKNVQNYVISSNICAGRMGMQQGAGIEIHSNTSTDHAENGWIIFNTIHYTTIGVSVEGYSNKNYIIGNLIYDITSANNDYCGAFGGSAECGWAIYIPSILGDQYIVDNTLYNVDAGILFPSAFGASGAAYITGNIISNRIHAAAYEIKMNDDANGEASVTMDRNLFYYAPGGVPTAASFRWNNDNRNVTYLQGLDPALCTNCVDTSDPVFVSTAGYNFNIQTTSPAKAANTESAVYDLFATTWAALGYAGLDIHYDKAGTARPQNTTWDIGAYEFITGGTTEYTLTVSGTTDTGTGVITADVGTIDCGATCNDDYSSDVTVTLTATASADSDFKGWTGGGCGGTGTCTILMSEDRTVYALFRKKGGAGTSASGGSATLGSGGTINLNY